MNNRKRKGDVFKKEFEMREQSDGLYRIIEHTLNTETGSLRKKKRYCDLTFTDAEDILFKLERKIIK